MSARVKPIALQILGKEYNIACTPEEQETLILSANKLDKEMRNLRDSGKINGGERIAVMVSLNIMHEFQLLKEKRDAPEQEFADQINNLTYKIESVLEN
ncbi:MAG: cell division protein ZapA [Methylococcaceae bacterium]|nr:cell division protein ZapA [Methylococcaceae bacterium]